MNNYNIMVRGILVNNDQQVAVQNTKRVKVYPCSDRENPKANRFVSMSGKVMDTLPTKGLAFWETLSNFINNNPMQERDVFFMGMLRPLGIEKGKAFKPDARQRAILEEAARMGEVMGRVTLMEGPERFGNPRTVPGTHWHWVFQVNPVQETERYSQIDERLHYTYGAIYTTPGLGVMKAGPGGNYVQVFKDKNGNHLTAASRTVARAREGAGRGLLVDHIVRHGKSLHGPEPDQRRGSLVSRQAQDKCRRFDRSLLRPQVTGGNGEQLDRNSSGQRLVPDVPLLQPDRGTF